MFGQNLPFSLAELSSFPSSSWITPPPVSLGTASPSSPIACSFFLVQSKIWYLRLGKVSAELEHNAVNCFTPRGWLQFSSGFGTFSETVLFEWNTCGCTAETGSQVWPFLALFSRLGPRPLPSPMVLCHHWSQTQNLFRGAIKLLRIFYFFLNEGPPSPFQEPLLQKGDLRLVLGLRRPPCIQPYSIQIALGTPPPKAPFLAHFHSTFALSRRMYERIINQSLLITWRGNCAHFTKRRLSFFDSIF